MSRLLKIGLLLGYCFIGLSACLAGGEQTNQRVVNVGMLLSGQLGDRSFNDSAYAGLQEAQRRHNIKFEMKEYISLDDSEAQLRNFAEGNYDIIIVVGFQNAAPLQTVAAEYPDQQFAIIDSTVEADNVASVVYREQEGDFLMGVLAAMLTQTGQVGFIGGMDIAPIQRIESGFRQGVIYQNSDVTVITDIAGTFDDPDVGKSLALTQYAKGADIIYNGAGRTGLGIIEAAKEEDLLTIGTSGDQRYLAPGKVVGNRPKRVDTAVLNLIEETIADNFTPGTRSLGLKEEGLALGPFDETMVTADILQELENLKEKIISGDIQVSPE